MKQGRTPGGDLRLEHRWGKGQVPAHLAGQGQEQGAESVPITVQGAGVGAPDSLVHGIERNSKDSFIHLNILLRPCHTVGTGDTGVDNTGRAPCVPRPHIGGGH